MTSLKRSESNTNLVELQNFETSDSNFGDCIEVESLDNEILFIMSNIVYKVDNHLHTSIMLDDLICAIIYLEEDVSEMLFEIITYNKKYFRNLNNTCYNVLKRCKTINHMYVLNLLLDKMYTRSEENQQVIENLLPIWENIFTVMNSQPISDDKIFTDCIFTITKLICKYSSKYNEKIFKNIYLQIVYPQRKDLRAFISKLKAEKRNFHCFKMEKDIEDIEHFERFKRNEVPRDDFKFFNPFNFCREFYSFESLFKKEDFLFDEAMSFSNNCFECAESLMKHSPGLFKFQFEDNKPCPEHIMR